MRFFGKSFEKSHGFAGGGSRRFNRFLAELTARADLFAAAGNCVAKKKLRTFRMPHGFDFATQNLGAREEFLHLIRKPPPLRKTVGFPNPCGNFSTKSRPTTPKVKVVRPEQIRLLLERATRFAGGGSHRFNHFLAELTARADLFAAAGNCVAKKKLRTFRMPHGFDFATQNLGTREESSHLARKAIPSP